MSAHYHYDLKVRCPEHLLCTLWPVERCGAVTESRKRCQRRAATGSLFCAASHGGGVWSQELAEYRRGHPLEVFHHSRHPLTVGFLGGDAPYSLLEKWGPISDEQLGAVFAWWARDDLDLDLRVSG